MTMGERDLTPESVEDYFASGVEMAFPLSDKSQLTLEIDPARHQLRLICRAAGEAPDVARYERISVDRINVIGREGDWYRLTVDARDMHYEAYTLLVSIVDQLDSGASFRHAVTDSLFGLKELLASRGRLTDEKEAGLIGELLVLEHVLDSTDDESAVASWLGPLSEEHDFGFDGFDAEVKTTRSESRVHVIGSETQLLPTAERDLYLVSIQITSAGDSSTGFALSDIVDRVRNKLDRGRRAFDRALRAAGWLDEAADLYTSRFELRSSPRAYLVDATFPAITAPMLDQVVPQRTLVSAVSYRVDTSHLPHADAPNPLSAFCERTEQS